MSTLNLELYSSRPRESTSIPDMMIGCADSHEDKVNVLKWGVKIRNSPAAGTWQRTINLKSRDMCYEKKNKALELM
jgi:hypothetical protein